MSFRGRKNLYVCIERCGWRAITIDMAEGVTPALIPCENPRCTPRTDSVMRTSYAGSRFYQVPEDVGEPTHEWYAPSAAARRGLSPAELDHVRAGGLLLRKRTAGQEAPS